MKKLSLFILTLLLSATCAWADVSVTEHFSTIGNVATANSTWIGDLCSWSRTQVARRVQDTIHTADYTQALFLPVSTSGAGTLTSTNLQGGIKSVSFKFARYGKENTNGRALQLKVSDGSTDDLTSSYSKSTMGAGNTSAVVSPATIPAHETYSHAFNNKSNAQLTITNVSAYSEDLTSTGICRILIADLAITPYIAYPVKETVILKSQSGYVNTLIDNTEDEGSISYASSVESVATVDGNGVITPVAAGTTVITATWTEGATAQYTLHVINGVVETFNSVEQSGSSGSTGSTWTTADLCNWENKYARRGTNDKMNNKQYTWLTLDGSTRGYIKTTNFEGGIKDVTFKYGQFGAESANTLKWQVSAIGSTTSSDIVERNGTCGENRSFSYGNVYSHTFNCAEKDAQLEIMNMSVVTSSGDQPTKNARILIGDIYITPYLLYTTKAHTIDTRVDALTYTNNDLINNTSGTAVEYSIAPTGSGATINAGTGEVTVTDATEGTFTVTAEWGNVSTTYTLTVVSRIATTASYSASAMHVGLDAIAIGNPLTYTPGYDGDIEYSSSNTSVATINASTGAITVNGVGQTTITANLPQTTNYKATSASYILYVRNNNGARIERFSEVSQPGVVGNSLTDLTGDLFTWQAQYQVRRGANDTIHAGTTNHQGTSIGIQDPTGTPKSSILQSKDVIEGGIKYLSFYWMQWGQAASCTRRIVVYADGTKIGEQEHPNGIEGRSGDEFLLGINNAMQSNKQLIIKNESYKGSVETLADNNCRIVMDTIYITPWLLYTNKDKQIMRIGGTYTRTPNINNTAGETGELSYISSNTEVATVNSSGQVTAVARGEATITAKFKWNETDSVTTSYKVEVFPVNCETFSQNATEHTYQTAEYGNSYTNPEPVVEDKCTWYAWLGGVVPSNYEPNVAVIRAPHTNEQGPAYIRSGELTGGIGSMTFDWNLVADESNINWDIRVLVNGREVKQLGNTDLSMTVLSNFGQITIDDINEPGDFVITFENHSTVTSGEYKSGNKARFVIDNVTWTSYSGAKTLYENMDNSSWLTAHDGETLDVAISRSALQSGKWNTLCLPFAISKSTDLGDAEVQRMTSATLNPAGDELEIVFTALAGDELVAGTPYLIKPTSAVSLTGFTGKTIEATPSSVTDGIVTLQGIFSPTTLYKDDNSTLFVGEPDGEGNNLFYPGVTGDLKGFRAYFKIGSGASPAPALRRARFVVNAHTTPTDAEEITNNKQQTTNKVLIDGQLIIIRDGVKYNAMGQQIQ